MKKKFSQLIASAVAYFIIAAIILGVIAVIALLSGSVMRIFGFEYESVWHIILFFIITMIVGFPLELLAEGLPRALVSLGRARKNDATIFYVILDTLCTAVAMAITDYFMDSVTARDLSILVIAILFSLTSIKDFREKLEKE